MTTSVFELFTIGIGPSSSHTVGPMRAARRFAVVLHDAGQLAQTMRMRVELFGSLALTGRGHGTDRAIQLGLQGETPESVDTDLVDQMIAIIRARGRLPVLGRHDVRWSEDDDLLYHPDELLPLHANAMRFSAFDARGNTLQERVYYSTGGGFVVEQGDAAEDAVEADQVRLPYPYQSGADLLALAVAEENAAGGRVVTAPTNGAAGILPAVLHYYDRFCGGATDQLVARFLLTAGAIGILYKERASISGAEVGCQGEVGVACSMAAAALTEALGGTVPQVEEAAEIGMEHNLGLTCDPVAGLVQVPCIERNAMGAVKAINASRLALRGTGRHRVSLDRVIETMRQTGADMQNKYKETSLGGLAVSLTEC